MLMLEQYAQLNTVIFNTNNALSSSQLELALVHPSHTKKCSQICPSYKLLIVKVTIEALGHF